jgi:hypothetical protein
MLADERASSTTERERATDYQSRTAALEAEIAGLNKMLADERASSTVAQRESNARLEALEAQHSDVTAQLSLAENRIEVLLARSRNEQDAMQRLRAKIVEGEAARRGEVGILQAQLSKERQRLAELGDSLAQATRQAHDYEIEITARESAIAALKASLAESLGQAQAQKEHLGRALGLLSKSSSEERRLAHELVEVHTKKREADDAASATVARLRHTIDEQQQAATVAAARLSAGQTKIDELGRLLYEMERHLRTREAEVSAVTDTMSWRVTRPWRHFSRSLAKVRQAVQKRPFETPHFDVAWYVQSYPDVLRREMDPYEHYLRIGAAEGRNPNSLFDSAWYLANNLDVQKAGINAHFHFIRHGAFEGRQPHPNCSNADYLQRYPLGPGVTTNRG